MRSLTRLLSVLTVGLLVLADATISPYVLHEKRESLPPAWRLARRHDPSAMLRMRFGLTQSNIDKIEEYLLDVSHPRSPSYGKHWTAGKVADTFAPSADTIEIVYDWLAENGFVADRVRITSSRGWIEVNATVSEAEYLLQAEYYVYEHESGRTHVACEKYHLPAHIQPHIDFVTPTINFNARLSRRSQNLVHALGPTFVSPAEIDQVNSTGLGACDSLITPDCLRALYNFYYEPLAGDRNSLAVVAYSPETFNPSDLQLFFQNYSTDLIGASPIFVSINGAEIVPSSDYIGEGNLDLQYSMSLATNRQNVTMYQVGDMVEGGSFDQLLDAIDGSFCTFEGGDNPEYDPVYPDTAPGGYDSPETCGTVKPTNVIATSYAGNEADFSYTFYARQCAEYAKFGLMGITVVYASGDNGVGGYPTGCCLNDYQFNPSYPSTCPYVTSVGATMMKKHSTVYEPETAAYAPLAGFYSGGGFSNYFPAPYWQKGVIDEYLSKYAPPNLNNTYNASGSRGYPDISANGWLYQIAFEDQFFPAVGTSCATPVAGTIFAMINDARLAIGKSPIGFVNPALYSAEFADAFNDITTGSNPGCDVGGFNATAGWDPVTGLGTPNFSKLLELWLLL